MKAKISEIFESIQGEGLYYGERQIFVRFFGCNLSCRFCDTKLSSFQEYEPQDLFKALSRYRARYHSISFTGGEPLLQKDFLKEILRTNSLQGRKNYLETNGTLPDELAELIQCVDIVAMDIKLPSSAGVENLWDLHRRFLEIASRKEVFLKAVICVDTKEEDIRESILLIRKANKAAILVLQPNSYDDQRRIFAKLENFREICRREKVTACVIPQLHKVAGIK